MFTTTRNKQEQYESHEEASFYAETTLPKLYSRDFGFSTALLKSAVFRPAIGARQTYTEDAPLTVQCASGDTVQLVGSELRQDDQTVLLAIIKMKQGRTLARSGTSSVKFVPRAFARDVLGWPDAGSSVEKLMDCVRRLKHTHIRMTYARGGEGTLSFVADYEAPKGGEWEVYLSPRLVEMFAGQTTYLNVEKRRSLREGLQTWLFGLVNADSCSEPFELASLRALAGAEGTAQKKFNANLRAALEVLLERQTIDGFEIDRKAVRIKRCAVR